jgi:hypothetical protein
MKGKIALCSRGALGLITEAQPKRVLYKRYDYCMGAISGADAPEMCKCETGVAYVGIHLTSLLAPVGSPWSSRTPVVVGDLQHGIQPHLGIDATHAAHRVAEWMHS